MTEVVLSMDSILHASYVIDDNDKCTIDNIAVSECNNNVESINETGISPKNEGSAVVYVEGQPETLSSVSTLSKSVSQSKENESPNRMETAEFDDSNLIISKPPRSSSSKFLMRESYICGNVGTKRRHSSPLPVKDGMCIMCLAGMSGCQCGFTFRNSSPFTDASFVANSTHKHGFSAVPNEIVVADLLKQREKSSMTYMCDFFLQHLDDDNSDMHQVFMMTYRYFMTPVELFSYIYQYYHFLRTSNQENIDTDTDNDSGVLNTEQSVSHSRRGEQVDSEKESFSKYLRTRINAMRSEHRGLIRSLSPVLLVTDADEQRNGESVNLSDSGLDLGNDVTREVICIHLLNMIKNWISSYDFDFDGDDGMVLLRSIRSFIAEDVTRELTLVGLTPPLFRLIEEKISSASGGISEINFDPTLWDPHLVAEQLSLIDWDLFVRITPPELTRQAWTKKATKNLQSPNVLAMISRFNDIAYWVASCIVSERSLFGRVQIIEHFLIIVDHCVALRCFNTAMEVFTGLNMCCIQRLKRTWSNLANEFRDVWTSLRNLLTPRMNYISLRKYMDELEGDIPVMPYVGILLADLVRIEETQSDFLNSNRINTRKFLQISDTMSALRNQQKLRLNIDEIAILKIQLLQNLLTMDEDRLYQESLVCEPLSISSVSFDNGEEMKDSNKLRSRLRHMLHRKSTNLFPTISLKDMESSRNSIAALTSLNKSSSMGIFKAKRNKRSASLSVYRKPDTQFFAPRILNKRSSVSLTSFCDESVDGKRSQRKRASITESNLSGSSTVDSKRGRGERASIACYPNSNDASQRKRNLSKRASIAVSSIFDDSVEHKRIGDLDTIASLSEKNTIARDHSSNSIKDRRSSSAASWGERVKLKLLRTFRSTSENDTSKRRHSMANIDLLFESELEKPVSSHSRCRSYTCVLSPKGVSSLTGSDAVSQNIFSDSIPTTCLAPSCNTSCASLDVICEKSEHSAVTKVINRLRSSSYQKSVSYMDTTNTLNEDEMVFKPTEIIGKTHLGLSLQTLI